MTTITIHSQGSPGAPSPILVDTWDQRFVAAGANRTSGNGADPTVYDDPAGAISEAQAEGIVGDGWMVTIA